MLRLQGVTLAPKGFAPSGHNFAHPYCSWEKGAIEHANKLIRQFIPKKADLTKYSQSQLTEIQHAINKRPRKKLNFESPKDKFYNFINRNYGSVEFET